MLPTPTWSRLAVLAAGSLFATKAAAQSSGSPPIVVAASAIAETWRNSAGGVRAANWADVLLDVDADLDLHHLGGPRGAGVLIELRALRNSRSSGSLVDDTGTFSPVSNIMAADHVRVYNVHYHQSWAEESWSMKVGQLAADDDFMQSDYAALFAHPTFGAMPSQVATPVKADGTETSAVAAYPVAAPGLWVRAEPSPAWSWQAGMYYGAPGADRSGNHGFEWAQTPGGGVLLFGELARTHLFAGKAATLRLGGTYHSGRFDDYRQVAEGRPIEERSGLASFYLAQDVTLLEDGAGKPKLGVFARAGLSPQRDRSVVTTYADAGLNWFGVLPRRPRDAAGVAASWTRLGGPFRRAAGLGAEETVVEVTYIWHFTERLQVQFDTQWVFQPSPAPVSAVRDTAVILGLRCLFAY